MARLNRSPFCALGAVVVLGLLCGPTLLVAPDAVAQDPAQLPVSEISQALPGAGLNVRVLPNGELGVELNGTGEPILGESGASNHEQIGQQGSTGSRLTFQIDGTTYMTGTTPDEENVEALLGVYAERLADTIATVRHEVSGLEVEVNHTLVRNATRIDVTVSNPDTVAHDFAFRQTLDIHLPDVDVSGSAPGDRAPYVWVPGQPGDHSEAPDGVYRRGEVAFTQVGFDQLRTWQTATGPDGPGDTKGVLWWHPDWGGVRPDRVIISKKVSAPAWDYSANSAESLTQDSQLMVYWGSTEPWNMQPGESRTLTFWYGRDVPSRVQRHFIEADLDRSGPGAGDNESRFVGFEAGEQVQFPFTVSQLGTLVGQPKLERVRLQIVQERLPAGWTARLVERASDATLADVVELQTGDSIRGRIRVTAPDDAAGEDTAVLRMVASVASDPPDADPLRDQASDAVRVLVTVRPKTGLGIQVVGDPELVLDPGELGTQQLLITNDGNLRDPLQVLLEATSVNSEPWTFRFVPSALASVAAEGTTLVPIEVTPSDGAGAGITDIVVQASAQRTGELVATSFSVKVRESGRLQLVADPLPTSIAPGGTRLIPVRMVNTGDDPAVFDVRVTPDLVPNWNVSHSATNVDGGLPAGGAGTVTIEVEAPNLATAGTRFEVGVSLMDPSGTRQLASTTVAAVVDRTLDFTASLERDDLTVRPGTEDTLAVRVKNHGNGDTRVTISPLALPPGLTLARDPDVLELGPDSEGTINVTIAAKVATVSGTHPMGLRVRSVGNETATPSEHGINVTVLSVLDAAIHWQRELYNVPPGGTFTLHGSYFNRGNEAETVTLTGQPDRWTVRLHEAIRAEPGRTVPVHAEVTVPRDAQIGQYELVLEPAVDGTPVEGTGQSPKVLVEVAAADLAVTKFVVDADDVKDRGLAAAMVTVTNRGNGASGAFEIVLYVDDKEVQPRGQIENLPPGKSARLRMAWLSPGAFHEVRVVADPEAVTGDPRTEDNERTANVRPATVLAFIEEAPASTFPLILLLTLALVALRPRRPYP